MNKAGAVFQFFFYPVIIGAFSILPVPVIATHIKLEDLNISASQDNPFSGQDSWPGSSDTGEDYFQLMPLSQHGISGLLKINPNVQFNHAQFSSKNSGEIEPEDIAINGAKFYQNNYLLDGININNDLNPSKRISAQENIAGKVLPDLGSVSQGLNLDTELLTRLKVHDSLVSARFGGFQGGVIQLITRDPCVDFHGKISVSHTQSQWTKLHIANADKDQFYHSPQSNHQPEFNKWKTSLTLEGSVSDHASVLFNYGLTASRIPVAGYDTRFIRQDEENPGRQPVMVRKNENFFLKAHWIMNDNVVITPSIIYAPSQSTYFNSNSKDSRQTMLSGGLSASVTVDYTTDLANYQQIIGYTRLESSRKADKKYWIQWLSDAKKPWGKTFSYEGGFGDIIQRQQTVSYQLLAEFTPVRLYHSEHQVSAGGEFKQAKGRFEIPAPFYTVTSIHYLADGERCLPDDRWCTMAESYGGKNYYQSLISDYHQGKTSATINQLALWLEDDLTIKNLRLRPGVRLETDNYMKKHTIAPRFASLYDLSGDGKTQFHFGLNRYYGRNAFALALKENREKLQSRRIRSQKNYSQWQEDSAWNQRAQKSAYLFRRLRIPYDDELALGLKQQIGNFALSVKYLNRQGRDQITAATAKTEGISVDGNKYKSNTLVYANHGKSNSHIYTLTINSITPTVFHGSKHHFSLTADYMDQTTNFATYDDLADADMIEDRTIKYDGKYIKYSRQPAKNFNTPWTIRFSTISEFPQLNLTWTNFFRIEDGYKYIQHTGNEIYQGEKIDVYNTKKYPTRLSWDARFSFAANLVKNQQIFINLDILNVLDGKKTSGVTSRYLATAAGFSDVVTYDTGRQFWLNIGYQW